MNRIIGFVLVAACLMCPTSLRADLVADLKTDWSDTNNSNTTSFGTWSYLHGSTLLPSIANFTFGGTGTFTVPQPAWAPGDVLGNFLPAEFKARSIVSAGSGVTVDYQVGDVITHTPDGANTIGSGAANFQWTSSINGTVAISGNVWAAGTLAGRNNAWSLLVNGTVVSSGSDIASYSRSNPFLLSNGSGGTSALLANVTVGSTIDLQLTKTTTYGFLVGSNLTITGTPAVPEPSSLLLGAIGMSATLVHVTLRKKA